MGYSLCSTGFLFWDTITPVTGSGSGSGCSPSRLRCSSQDVAGAVVVPRTIHAADLFNLLCGLSLFPGGWVLGVVAKRSFRRRSREQQNQVFIVA